MERNTQQYWEVGSKICDANGKCLPRDMERAEGCVHLGKCTDTCVVCLACAMKTLLQMTKTNTTCVPRWQT